MISIPRSTDDFARVRELFHRACELPPVDRGAYLDDSCSGRPDLRIAVEELLVADSRSGAGPDPLAQGLGERLLREPPAHAHPERIGPYHIQRVLGEGGMGIAYLARQNSPERDVALKVLRPGASSPGLRARFAREVRALARLRHPGIAHIYEAGTADTPAGPLSYFAMEFVDGPRLTDYANGANLDIPARLELVAAVADAVQHAHTKGVIHRDLKPGNILVREAPGPAGDTGDSGEPRTGVAPAGPRPVILDFGVARVLDPDANRTAVTEPGLLLGTIAYMSPEQLAADDEGVDTRTDVYSLGVILYELLSGRLPFDVRTKPVPEAARIIRDDEPRPLVPTDSPAIGRLDRDLATIVQRAMNKDRTRRYPTAAALAEDLRRYLRHEPILARPATVMYQFSRFARRHRGLVAGAAIAIAALGVGLCVSLALFVQARASRIQAQASGQEAIASQKAGEQIQTYLIEDLLKAAGPDRLGPQTTIIEAVLKGREGLHERFADQPLVEAKLRASLGDVLIQLERRREAVEELDAAVTLFEQHAGRNDPRTIGAMLALSRTHTGLNHHVPARALADDALARARAALPPADPLLRDALERAAQAGEPQSAFAAAATLYREALALAQADPGAPPESIDRLMTLVLRADRRRRKESEGQGDSMAAAIAQRAAACSPDDPRKPAMLGTVMRDHRAQGRTQEALVLAAEIEALLTALPPDSRDGLLYQYVAEVYQASGQFEHAQTCLLLAHRLLSEQYPNVGIRTQRSAQRVAELFAAWPGHGPQFRDWTMRTMAYRLMLEYPRDGAPSGANRAKRMLDGTTEAMSAAELLDEAWNRRDELAPPGHPRRSAYLANLAREALAAGHPDHAAEAIALGQESLGSALDVRTATQLLELAREKLP